VFGSLPRADKELKSLNLKKRKVKKNNILSVLKITNQELGGKVRLAGTFNHVIYLSKAPSQLRFPPAKRPVGENNKKGSQRLRGCL